MKKFNYLFLFFNLLILNCNENGIKEEHLQKNQEEVIVDDLNTNSSITLGISDNLSKKAAYNIKTTTNDGITVDNADFVLKESEFKKFKENYGLIQYNKVLQVYLLSDSKLNYSNHKVTNKEIQKSIIYYLDENNKPHFDIISKVKLESDKNKSVYKTTSKSDGNFNNEFIINTYNNISDIYSNAVNYYLLEGYDVKNLPLFSMVQSEDTENLKSVVNWSLLSQDSSYMNIYDLYNDGFLSYGCLYRCSGNGGECSNFNPGVCGSVCQMVESVNEIRLQPDEYLDSEYEFKNNDFSKNNSKTKKTSYNDLANYTVKFFPELYELRTFLNTSSKGKKLVNSYYDLSYLVFKGKVNIPLSVKIEILSAILKNSKKITTFNEFTKNTINNELAKETLYNNNDLNSYLSILGKLRSLSKDKDFVNIIDLYETTIKEFENKSLYDISKKFKNEQIYYKKK